VPKAPDIARFQNYLTWIEQNLGLRAELVKVRELPDWRRRLLKVVKE
jgi:hypothetical protein